MRIRVLSILLISGTLFSTQASAQVPWESPLLVGPAGQRGFSFFITDPGYGLGAMVHWTGAPRGVRLGYRVGIADEPGDDLGAFGGIDVSGPLVSHSQDFPLDVVWVTGAGIGFGDDALLSFPLGVSLGRVLAQDGVRFHLYTTPRLMLDARLGDGPGDDTDLGFALDLGADFAFSRGFQIRFGASVGDREGVAIGMAFPTQR